MGAEQVKEAAKEFAPQALKKPGAFAVAEEVRQYGKLPVLLARMNPDLAMSATISCISLDEREIAQGGQGCG